MRTPPDGPHPPDQVDAAAAALERVRLAAREDGFQPGVGSPAHARHATGSRQAGSRRSRTKSTTPGAPGDTIKNLGSLFSGLIADRGWREPVAVGSVIGRWDELVGPEVAAHAQVETYENTKVVIACDSTAWATQLKLMAPQLRARFDRALGAGVITEIEIKGPAAPTWTKGPRVVRGRGPRDTYG